MLPILKKGIRTVARAAGYDIVRASSGPQSDPPPLPSDEEWFARYLPHRISGDMRRLAEACESLSAMTDEPARTRSTRALLRDVIENPEAYRFLQSDWARVRLEGSEIYAQASGALSFARGDLASAEQSFRAAAGRWPTRLNFLCLGRTLMSAGQEARALEQFEAGLKTLPDDVHLTMEAATSLFRVGKTQDANAYLGRVRSHLSGQVKSAERLSAEILAAVEHRTLQRTGGDDIYDLKFVEDNWWQYWHCFHAFTRYQEGSAWLADTSFALASALLRGDSEPYTTFINFGAFCSQMDQRLAKANSAVTFVGVDRQPLIKQLNEAAFPAHNLRYVAADIMDVLDSGVVDSGRTVLFHARTACLCYPSFLRELYSKAARRGIRTIFLYEGLALSRQHLKFFDLGDMPAISMANQSIMFIHDYATLLNDAGYNLTSEARIPPSMLLDGESGWGAVSIFLRADLERP